MLLAKTSLLTATIMAVFGCAPSAIHQHTTTHHSSEPARMPIKNTVHTAYYSARTRLLARMITQRYANIQRAYALKIAHDINRDTRHIAWPTPLDVAAIIEIESQYNPHAVSSTGARGLMQISAVWSHSLPQRAYTSIGCNIRYGVHMLDHYYKMYHNNAMAAVLIYNSGRYAYNSGQAWSTYWWRFQSAKRAFDTLYTDDVTQNGV